MQDPQETCPTLRTIRWNGKIKVANVGIFDFLFLDGEPKKNKNSSIGMLLHLGLM